MQRAEVSNELRVDAQVHEISVAAAPCFAGIWRRRCIAGGKHLCEGVNNQVSPGVTLKYRRCLYVMQHAMQGFGNVGAWAAEMIHVRGGRVLCVSDRDGAMTNEKGLDIPALRRHLRAAPPFGGSLLSFPGGKSCLSNSPTMLCNTLCSNHMSSSKLAGDQQKQCQSAELPSCSLQSCSRYIAVEVFTRCESFQCSFMNL